MVKNIVAGFAGGKVAVEKMIVSPGFAFVSASRNVPGPMLAVLVTVRIAEGDARKLNVRAKNNVTPTTPTKMAAPSLLSRTELFK